MKTTLSKSIEVDGKNYALSSFGITTTDYTEKGKLHLSKAGLCAYAHGEYFSLGKQIGDFGFSVRRKSVEKRRKQQAKADKEKKNGKNR